jgi:transposase
MTDHTTISKVSRLEVIQVGRRRRWTLKEKRRIVAESHEGGRQVSATARRHGLSASQLFAWRRLAREGRLGEAEHEAVAFAPVVMACAPAMDTAPSLSVRDPAAEHPPCRSAAAAAGRMEIVLGRGRRVIVDRLVDAVALARVVAVLERP